MGYFRAEAALSVMGSPCVRAERAQASATPSVIAANSSGDMEPAFREGKGSGLSGKVSDG